MNKGQYEEYVKRVTPTHTLWKQLAKAFLVGGLFCVFGQLITNAFMLIFKMEQELASSWCSISLIFISALLTGLNIYPKLVKFGGAGALVPITGFANSVAAPAIEFKKEGQVFGIGCKIFTIAGPVILYGVFISFVLGLIYYFLR